MSCSLGVLDQTLTLDLVRNREFHLFAFELSSDISCRKPFFLKLDATVSLPLDLTVVSQSLDALICDKPNGPSGKFFLDVNARKLLDTVRTGGPSARASISESASEEQKAHFARFRSRLDQGELVC